MFLLSNIYESKKIMVERTASWLRSPATAGVGARRKRCIFSASVFVLQCPALKRNVCDRRDGLSHRVRRVQVWRSCQLLSISSFGWDGARPAVVVSVDLSVCC